jgi:hypothetical protein
MSRPTLKELRQFLWYSLKLRANMSRILAVCGLQDFQAKDGRAKKLHSIENGHFQNRYALGRLGI